MNELVLKWLEESVNFGIFTTDKKLIINSWNRWLELNTGKKADEIIGKGLFDIYPQIKESFIANLYRDALEGLTCTVAQRLHNYIIPIELSEKNDFFDYMQQSGIISALVDSDNVIGTITFIEDVTERIKTEKRLSESEERYRRFIEASSDMVFLKDDGLHYIMANKAYFDLVGKRSEEIIGRTCFEFGPKDVAERCLLSDKKALETEDLVITEENIGDRVYEVRKFPVTLPNMKRGVGGFVRDITENKNNINILEESREKFHHLNLVLKAVLHVNKLIVQERDVESLVRKTCAVLVETRGYNHALIMLKGDYNIISSSSTIYDTEDIKRLEAHVRFNTPDCIERALNTNDVVIIKPYTDCPLCPLKKDMTDERCALVRIEYGGKIYGVLSISISAKFINSLEEKELFTGVAEDLGFAIYTIEQENKRKQVEENLKKNEEFFRTIFENTGTAMLIVEEDTTISFANENALRLVGYERDDFIGKKRWTEFVADKEELDRMTRYHYLRRQDPDGAPKTYEFQLKDRKGNVHDILLIASMMPGTKKSVISLQDITPLKDIQKRLADSEKRYRSIFENAVEGIFQTTPDGKLISVNPSLARMLGYSSPEELISSVSDVSKDIYVNMEDRERFKAIIEKKGEVKNFEIEAKKKDKSHIWMSYNVRAVRDEKGNIVLYEGTVEDITERKRSEIGLKESFDRLRKTIGSIVDVISMAVEARDPYTSGHQKRVANLARTIATQMGLSPVHIEYVRMAGAIHDLGKISVPAEILSAPRKLTGIEFELVKQHPEIGYNILKNIDDLQTVAEIVYQHHEKLDGSGYPRGLKGDEILLEARILTVADVVEAMASHRPYRPSLGIDAALEEVEKNAGILYDESVVKACLNLFKEKGFKLEQ